MRADEGTTPIDDHPDTIAVGIVAEVRLYRESLAMGIARRPPFAVAWTAGGLADAVARVAEGSASAVILDIATDESLRIIREIRRADPRVPVIAFAAHEVDREIIACAEAGVAGFVPCEASIPELAAAVASALRGEVRCSPRAAAVLLHHVAALAGTRASVEPAARLTARENDVLALVDRGLSNKEIARRLHIQVATVKNHIHNLLEKLQATTRGEAAARQHRSRLPHASRPVAQSADDHARPVADAVDAWGNTPREGDWRAPAADARRVLKELSP